MNRYGKEYACRTGETFLEPEGHTFEKGVDREGHHDDERSGSAAEASLFVRLWWFEKIFRLVSVVSLIFINR